MKLSQLQYWRRGFNYDRSHPTNNKVAIEAFRILLHYTTDNKNCRVGVYFMQNNFSEFYSLQRIIPSFDLFAKVATEEKPYLEDYYPDYIKEISGPTLHEQIQEVYLLKYPIWFEFTARRFWSNLFGYKFNSSLRVRIDPVDIKKLEGLGLGDFSLMIKDYTIRVQFTDQISIL